jgi:hypothetical protein
MRRPEVQHLPGSAVSAPARVRVVGSRFSPQVPAEAVYVGRESPYLKRSPYANPYSLKHHTLTESRDLFRANVLPGLDLAPLRGWDLACWCPLDAAWCHASDILEAANR